MLWYNIRCEKMQGFVATDINNHRRMGQIHCMGAKMEFARKHNGKYGFARKIPSVCQNLSGEGLSDPLRRTPMSCEKIY